MKSSAGNSREVVIVLHGFGGSPLSMMLICRRIAKSGRRVLNWGYSSWRHSITRSADRLLERIQELHEDESIDRIHFVTYSLGSIICRAALLKNREFGKLGRIVMLGPPNRGSHVASFFAPWVGRVVPAVRELCSRPKSFVNRLPRLTDVQVGIIAGRSDCVVRMDNTHLPSQQEHVLVPGGHASLLVSRRVTRMALNFVEAGTFASQPVPVREAPVVFGSLTAGPLSTMLPLEQA